MKTCSASTLTRVSVNIVLIVPHQYKKCIFTLSNLGLVKETTNSRLCATCGLSKYNASRYKEVQRKKCKT